jgi:hypothetical protein
MPTPPPLAAQPALAMEATENADVSAKPDIFESRMFDIGRVHSTRQQERREEEDETRKYQHQLKENAQMELEVQKQALVIRKFCRKKQWPYRLNLVSTYVQFLR